MQTPLAYLLLAFRRRFEHYESMGGLFRTMSAEQLEQTLDKRLWGLFMELLNEICELLEMDIEIRCETLMNYFLNVTYVLLSTYSEMDVERDGVESLSFR